jgi:carboxyl-terminal processing protease
MQRYNNGELESEDNIKVADSLKFTTPKGKVVYGGGGTIPDVFVPIGSHDEEVIAAMDARGYFSSFAFEHLEEDRTRYAEFSSQDKFLREFTADDILFEKLIDFMNRYNFPLNFYEYEGQLKLYIKAAIAEQLFSPDLKAEVLAPADPMLQKVLNLDNPTLHPSGSEL